MSLFMLDTETVSSSASSMDSLAKQVLDLSDRVSGYDTSCQEFDFAAAKSVISNNLEACSIKIANTASLMNSVVTSHTTLQSRMHFQSSEEKAAEEAAKARNAKTSSSSSGYYGGGYSSGRSSYRGSSSARVTTLSSSIGSQVSEAAAAQLTPLVSATKNLVVKPATAKPFEIKKRVEKINHGGVILDQLSRVGKNLFELKNFVYSPEGYATIGEMFVIACSKEYGKVGDIIEFTLTDGQKFKCIIGQIDDKEEGSIRFFVNGEWKEDGEDNFQDNIGKYIVKIENLGVDKEYAVSATIKSAVDWAEEIAADDIHGYSQESRWGDPNYDCSSFIISAFEEAGISVRDAGATYTGNMKETFIESGFEWIPGTPNVDDLQPGDVLLRVGYHTEMYVGDGKMIGAHSNTDGHDGDSSGGEISVTDYKDKKWDGVLRYVGNSVEKRQNIPVAPRVEEKEEEDEEKEITTDDKMDEDAITKLVWGVPMTL